MTWQDELRQLDEELAAGRLSAEDYRRRRDELLSQAASGRQQGQEPTPPPPAGPPTGAQAPAEAPQGGGPTEPGTGNPFPPPFRWDQTPAAESTQIMRPVSPDGPTEQPTKQGDGDRTQVVPGSGSASGAQPAGDGDADRTQVVPGATAGPQGPPSPPTFPPRPPQNQPNRPPHPGGPGQGPGGPGGPGQGPGSNFGQAVPPWQQQPNTTPPWSNSDLPPQTDMQPAWLRQGPESFEVEKEPRSAKTWIFVVAAVVAVALIGGVIYFVAFRPTQPSAGPETTTTTQPAPTTTTRQLTPIEAALEAIPEPPGEQDADNGILTLDQAVQLQLLSEAEAQIVRAAGVTEVAYRGSVKGLDEFSEHPDVFETLAFLTPDAATAQDIAAQLKVYQEANGLLFIPEPLPDTPASVVFEKQVNPVRSVYRGLYVSEATVVRLNVVQEPLKDEAALSGSYQRQMRELIKAFEPDA